MALSSPPPLPTPSAMFDDKALDDVTFITSKPLLQRLDVTPFILAYSIAIGGYMNSIEEWSQIMMMIVILILIVIHAGVLLAGYWHVTFRVKVAYNTHSKSEVMKQFERFDKQRYSEGIRYSQEEYEGSLTGYKLWYTIYDKKLMAARQQHTVMVRHYNANPDTTIPPGPFIPPEPPLVPQMGNPVVVFNNTLLEVCIVPDKHHGNPVISRVVYEVADNTRCSHVIQGLLSPKEVLAGKIDNHSSQIQLTGPALYPPFQFSYHHAQYIMDPHVTYSQACFRPRQYPDNDKLFNYLTHHHTPTTPTPDEVQLKLVANAQIKGIAKAPIATVKNSITMSELFRTASSSASSSYRLLQFGFNSLTVPIPGFITLFIENAMSPFFVFQIACVLLWLLDEYWYYSLFTLVMLVIIEGVMVYKRQSHLTQMLGEKPPLPFVHVYRRFETATQTATGFKSTLECDLKNNSPLGGWILTPTKQLIPGDIVAFPVYTDSQQINQVFGSPISATGDDDQIENVNVNSTDFLDRSVRPTLFSTEIPCDMLLLSGSCVCDESMLSGESVPQVKEDLISLQTSRDGDANSTKDEQDEDELQQSLDDKIHKRYQLYSGTKLIGIQRNYQHSFFSTTGTLALAQKTKAIKTNDGGDQNNDINQDIEQEEITADLLADKRANFLTLTSRPPLPIGTEVILCRVLRTGFATTQGSLVRTILTAADNVMVDKEALYFILGLLCCAIVSAYFVIIEGLADITRSRYKLLLNVITILTSVVPPELPLQLSMAVNNALASLAKTQVFCTEPNRLPSAGRIDICCFDKTGTLSNDKFLLACAVTPDLHKSEMGYVVMELGESGCSNVVDNDDDDDDDDDNNNNNNNNQGSSDSPSTEHSLDLCSLPIDTRLVLGSAQELAMLQLPPRPQSSTDDSKPKPTQRIVGDPMEAEGFTSAGFTFFPRQPQQQQQTHSSDGNINNKIFFNASPVIFDPTQKLYISQPKQNKIRFDTEILHRFTFQSQLQRMSSIVAITPSANYSPDDYATQLSSSPNLHWLDTTLPIALRQAASKTFLRVVTKGSPEMIYNSLHTDYRPDFNEYTRQHKALARRGLRVLALAWKPVYIDTHTQMVCNLPDPTIPSSHDSTSKGSLEAYRQWLKLHPRGTPGQFYATLKIPQRDHCETNLFFAGIVGFNSPLKTQSLDVITHLQQSNHKTIMITGDHLLTAIAVAKSLDIAKENCLLLSKEFLTKGGTPTSPKMPPHGEVNTTGDFKLVWKNEFEETVRDFSPTDPLFDDLYTKKNLTTSLCINGDALAAVIQEYPQSLSLLCTVTSVFARTLPSQKESILKYLREFNNNSQTCLMCGDGTNDVGALTHANIGIALSSMDTDSHEQLAAQEAKFKEMYRNPIIKRYLDSAQKLREKGFIPQAENMEKQAHDMFKRLQQSKLGSLAGGMMNEMDMDDDDPGSVKLGDASLAASFSAKHGSIRCVLDVIRQGRCALATTGQMYQILALQCLIAAYSLSALYFKGVRQSESQMTVGGIVATTMSTLLSYAQPLEKISARRPNSKIFSPYNITTIGLQFIVHLGLLMYMVNYAMEFTDIETLKQGQDESITKYIPSVLNSVVFILSTAMSATTILSNYVGFPFMTPLTMTKLLKVILGTIAVCCALSMEMIPELNEMLELSPMPNEEFIMALTGSIVIDCVVCVIIGLSTKLIFGVVTWDDLTQPIAPNVISQAMASKGPAGLHAIQHSQQINTISKSLKKKQQ